MKKISLILLLLLSYNISTAQLLAQEDKQKHFVAGSIVGAISYGVILQETEDKHLAFFGSIATSFVAGYLKETFDKKQGIPFDNEDLAATALGGLSIGITLDIFTRQGKKRKRIINLK